MAPGADATGVEGRRYRRRIDALAPAGDTVEIVKVQRGSKGIAAGVSDTGIGALTARPRCCRNAGTSGRGSLPRGC